MRVFGGGARAGMDGARHGGSVELVLHDTTGCTIHTVCVSHHQVQYSTMQRRRMPVDERAGAAERTRASCPSPTQSAVSLVSMATLRTGACALAFVLAIRTIGAQLNIPSVTDTAACDWAQLPDKIHDLDSVCCFESSANPGARCRGVTCDVSCAAQLLPLLHDCHP